jgi:hemoglobin
MDLDAHLPVLGDFWEKVLFNTADYNGPMMDLHRSVHEHETFTPAHFQRWLSLWDHTIDGMFTGPVARQAKDHAARIAIAMHRNLYVTHNAAQPMNTAVHQ